MKKSRLVFNLVIAASILFSIQACTNTSKQNDKSEQEITTGNDLNEVITQREVEVNKAICVLHPTEGNNVTGAVTFSRDGEDIKIVAEVEGLTPGKHGFHIHEYGNCSANDGTSAGGHYNPEGVEHAGPDNDVRHFGDLGNLEAGEDGKAYLEYTDDVISLHVEHSIIGLGIIVHASEDDLTSQPTGAVGARVACGVIGIDE